MVAMSGQLPWVCGVAKAFLGFLGTGPYADRVPVRDFLGRSATTRAIVVPLQG